MNSHVVFAPHHKFPMSASCKGISASVQLGGGDVVLPIYILNI